MEEQNNTPQPEQISAQPEVTLAPTANNLNFLGTGTELLGITLLNMVLSIVTLGLYYPWARVNRLKFLYQNTYLNDTPFVFSGTGKELFKGFVKFFVAIVVVYGIYIWAQTTHDVTTVLLATLLLVLFFACIVPLAIHGALRYRLSRTSWRGIHFGYRGDRGQLFMDMWLGYFLSAITFGLYNSWFVTKLRTYIIGNVRFGNVYFGYDGEGGELFWINFKGGVLTFLTLGLYYFWYKAEFMRYFANHTYLEHDGKKVYLEAHYSGGDLFGLIIVNLLISLFTFGFGVPFAEVRTAKFMLDHLHIPADINFDNLAQTEDDYSDATGDDVLDYLDMGIV
jgi:uncharacterized membrane protein YjgN (DUF898 family)